MTDGPSHVARVSIIVCKQAESWDLEDSGQDMDCSLRIHANASNIYLLLPPLNGRTVLNYRTPVLLPASHVELIKINTVLGDIGSQTSALKPSVLQR